MSRPADEQPTTVLPQQTVEQPSVTTSPATRRSRTWHHRIPARIGRARTSTVVIGALFLLLGGVNVLFPADPYVTVDTEYGEVRVPASQVTRIPTPTPTSEAPAGPADTEAPRTSAPAPATSAPRTTAGEEDTTTPAPTSAPEDEETTAPTTTSAQPTSSSRSTTTSTPSRSTASATPTATATATADPTG